MERDDILKMLRRNRWWILIVFFISFISSGYFLIPYVIVHPGETTFYLANNETQVNPAFFSRAGKEDFMQINQAQERAYHLVFSTEMLNYLIKEFDLYRVYKIDSGKPYHYEEIVRKLSRKISFNKVNSDLSKVTVMDRNNERAANMANALVAKLDQLNKKYIAEKIRSNLKFYEAFLNESTKVSAEQNRLLKEYIELFSKARHTQKGEALVRPLSEVEFSLYQAASRMSDINEQLSLARLLYEKALDFQRSDKLSSIIIIKHAIPEIKSRKEELVLFAGMAAVVISAVFILLIYFFNTYKRELQMVFGR
jgi:hypothetical protein